MLYPLKFKPFFKEKIWGGQKIARLLNRPVPAMSACGESWELSALEDNVSVVDNGYLAGDNDINELIEIYMGELVGDKVFEKYGLGFPLLIKYIDAADDLSVQVHPDDKLAKQRYDMNGKTECWFVIQAEPGAGLYVGFKEGVTREQYWQAVDDGAVDKLLQFYPVKAGDFFFIPAGTVHAIGKGVLLAEIQQPSDITYRIFDWNRTDAEGNSRELHIDEAYDAIKFGDGKDFVPEEELKMVNDKEQKKELTEEQIPAGKVSYEYHFDATSKVFRSPFFNINLIDFEKPLRKNYSDIDSFILYMCLEGHVHGFTDDEQLDLFTGDVLLVPAATNEFNLVPSRKSRLLEVYLP